MSEQAVLLAKLASKSDDPVLRALLTTAQERVERTAEIARIDGEVSGMKQQLQQMRHEALSLRQAKDDLSRQLNAMTMSKDTVNVYDLEHLLNESWDKCYQEVGMELRRIRIDLGLPEIAKDSNHCIPGTPKNRQPREHHKAVVVEFCRKHGYKVPPILQ